MARSLGGTDTDKIDCGTSSLLNPQTAMTFVCWAYATSFPNAYNAIFKRQNAAATAYYTLQPKSTGKLALYYVASDGTASYDGSGSNTLSTSTWYHLAFVLPASGTAAGYVNGAQDGLASFARNGIADLSGETTGLGYDPRTTDSGWAGYLAEAAVYNAELTLAELVTLAKGYSPLFVRPASLNAYWPLVGKTSPEVELINGLGGTLTGTAAAPHPRIITPSRPMIGHNSAGAAPGGFQAAWARGANTVIGAGARMA
jgi:hypothetical protein